jgi:hypothetical protein
VAISEVYVSSAGAGAHDGTSEANAFSWTEMATDINAGSAAGKRYNVKGNIGALGASTTLSGSGTGTSPVIIRGYTTTIGDGYQGRTNANGPLITTHMPLVPYNSTFRLNITGSWIILEALKVTGLVSNPVVTLTADSLITRCIVENSSTNASASALSIATRCKTINSDMALTGASGGNGGILGAGGSAMIVGCRATGATAPGILITSTSVIVSGCVVYGSSVGISNTSGTFVGAMIGNTIVDNTGDGIDILTGTTSLLMLVNNLITDNGGFGLDANSTAVAISASHNRFDRNTSGATNSGTDWLAATSYDHNTTSVLKAVEYQDAATRDYRLLTTSPAKGVGLPSYLDIGALQRQESASSATGYVIGG